MSFTDEDFKRFLNGEDKDEKTQSMLIENAQNYYGYYTALVFAGFSAEQAFALTRDLHRSLLNFRMTLAMATGEIDGHD